MSNAITHYIMHDTYLFCRNLCLLQKKQYYNQHGIEGTISCVFCPYPPKLVNKAKMGVH